MILYFKMVKIIIESLSLISKIISFRQNENFYFGETQLDTFEELPFTNKETLNDLLNKVIIDLLRFLRKSFKLLNLHLR